MSDTIEHDGKTYYAASYLELANNNAKRRGDRIAELNAEIARLRELLGQCRAALRVEKGKADFRLPMGSGREERDCACSCHSNIENRAYWLDIQSQSGRRNP